MATTRQSFIEAAARILANGIRQGTEYDHHTSFGAVADAVPNLGTQADRYWRNASNASQARAVRDALGRARKEVAAERRITAAMEQKAETLGLDNGAIGTRLYEWATFIREWFIDRPRIDYRNTMRETLEGMLQSLAEGHDAACLHRLSVLDREPRNLAIGHELTHIAREIDAAEPTKAQLARATYDALRNAQQRLTDKLMSADPYPRADFRGAAQSEQLEAIRRLLRDMGSWMEEYRKWADKNNG